MVSPFRSRLFHPSSHPSSRREFVATTSKAFAGMVLARHTLLPSWLQAQPLPKAVARSRHSADAFLPECLPPLDLQRLATVGIDAATTAGASYADIRVGESHRLAVGGGVEVDVYLRSTFTYGVRVLVDGAWAFVYGRDATPEAIAVSARQAVATARGYAPLLVHRAELAPAPVVTGEWATPFIEDPFSVPLHDHAAVMYAYSIAGRRVNLVTTRFISQFEWTRERRVFASSTGSLTTQAFLTLNPWVSALGVFLDPYGMDGVDLAFPDLVPASGGFELVTNPAFPNAIKRWNEEVIAPYAALPTGTIDVGRYPVVFDGRSTAMLLGCTLGRALELDRVLGDEAGASGTSYLSPPSELLGTMIASPKLTVGAHRSLPSSTAAKWDDEGVETHPYALVTDGRLVDYHTSRQHAMALKEWYAQHHQPLRSHGSVMLPNAADPVTIRAPHLTIAPGDGTTDIDALYRDMKHGVLVIDSPACVTDQGLATAFINVQGAPVLEIRNGKPVRRLRGIDLEMSAKRLWKEQLVALGGPRTVGTKAVGVCKGMPWVNSEQLATAPAMLLNDVNVVSTERFA